MMTLPKRIVQSQIVRSSAALLVSDSASTAVGVVTSAILARKLGSETLALVFLAIAIVDSIQNFLDIRPEEGIIRFVGNAMALDQRRRAITFFYVGLLIDILLMLATVLIVAITAPPAASIYPQQPDMLRNLTFIYMLAIPFNGTLGTFGAVLHTFKRFNLIAIVSLAQRVLFLLYVIFVADNVSQVMWGYVLQEAVGLALLSALGLWLLRKHVQTFRAVAFCSSLREFIPFAFHTSVTASLKVITTNIDVLVIGAMRPLPEVAAFKIGRNAAMLIVLPTLPMRTVIYPELNEAWARKNIARAQALIKKYMAACLVTGIGLFVALALTANWLVTNIYGPDYIQAADILRILAVGLVLQSLFSWIRPAAMADNQPQLVTFYSVVTSLVYAPMLVIAVYLGGVMGAALAFDLWMAGSTLLFIFYVIPRLQLRLFFPAPKQTTS